MPQLSNLDLMKLADSFPYPDTEPEGYAKFFDKSSATKIYSLLHPTPDGPKTIGYILKSMVENLQSIPESICGPITVDEDALTIQAFELPTEAERTAAVQAVMKYWRDNKTWEITDGWRNELWPVYGSNDEVLYEVERSCTGLLGAMRYGVHMTAYVKDEASSHGMKIWVPRRSATKSTYPSMLDNSVAGGLTTREDPFEAMIREGDEEASLPEALMRERCKQTGTVTYINITDKHQGQKGLIYPEAQWVYDIELPADVKLEPKDGEAEEFYLWTVDEVQEAMARGEFKTNCALILLEFFVRHGILTPQNEPDYDEIVRRMHRKLLFPGPHQKFA
ncbi:NUDIX hydrolase domain-like protein [Pseudomassariella vexata]|uniref:NUDIX hydrolase domain-like protein n=1 Tax=Pseudomassariella vexata TaxID=1141098 RepID=A0A1Y2DJQ3_9PEZI|nr:NUDIX hydrolase domain-like protein [Pseudomassariella vexata]ORY59472.1 NUDIX hydrolase domain-like protein [Pseudomassariella vexata]